MMVNGAKSTPEFITPMTSQGAYVAQPLSDLTVGQRKKVTTELKRIHMLVSALDPEQSKDAWLDKSDKADLKT